jgi:outer membrane protein assembly factor BamC
MTTRKIHDVFKRSTLSLLVLTLAAGCSSVSGLLEADRIDYKSSKKPSSNLDVPPDLTQLQRDNRYALPDTSRGVATASEFGAQRSTQPVTTQTVLPETGENMRIERAGGQRWLVVQQPPEALWPQLKEFWQDAGFLINVESQQTGVMETDWAENRAKIPQDFIRNTIGKVFDSAYSTGERDKFRTRLERTPDGGTEIYISHRGAEEVLTGREKESTVWTSRESDPELEAEFLSRLMARLSGDEKRTEAQMAAVQAPAELNRAKLVKGSDGTLVEVNEGFDRAWRRVGLALDRVGFTVEDRDRSQGVYFVRYVNQNQDAKDRPTAEKGFLARWFGSSDKGKEKTAERYQVVVKAAGDGSQVAVLDDTGNRDTSKAANRILTLLSDQLK